MALLDCRSLGPIPYETAWELQKRLVDALLAERQRRGPLDLDADAAAEEQLPPSLSPRRRRRRSRPVGALILLQHEPVYTLGAGATTENLRFDPGRAFLEGEGRRGEEAEEQQTTTGGSNVSGPSPPPLPPPPAPLHRVERGGEVTWHGPGQLVLYPILDLRAGEGEGEGGDEQGGEGGGGGGAGAERRRKGGPFLADLHWYLRALEEVVVSALARLPSHPLLLPQQQPPSKGAAPSRGADRRPPPPPPLLAGEREPGLTGVWVGGAKAAALGVRAARWATYHGLALNVNSDLTFFDHIVPCGIAGREVASVVTAWEREVRRRRRRRGRSGLSENGGGAEEEEEEEPVFELPPSWKAHPGEGPLVAAAGDALLAAFCDVLGVRLESVGEIPRELLLPSSKDGEEGEEEEATNEEEEGMVSFAERVVRGEEK